MSELYTFEMITEREPLQVEGRRESDDAPYHFHARYGWWELLVGDPDWETCVLEWPGNGWNEFVVATGLEAEGVWLDEAGVRALLDEHLIRLGGAGDVPSA